MAQNISNKLPIFFCSLTILGWSIHSACSSSGLPAKDLPVTNELALQSQRLLSESINPVLYNFLISAEPPVKKTTLSVMNNSSQHIKELALISQYQSKEFKLRDLKPSESKELSLKTVVIPTVFNLLISTKDQPQYSSSLCCPHESISQLLIGYNQKLKTFTFSHDYQKNNVTMWHLDLPCTPKACIFFYCSDIPIKCIEFDGQQAEPINPDHIAINKQQAPPITPTHYAWFLVSSALNKEHEIVAHTEDNTFSWRTNRLLPDSELLIFPERIGIPTAHNQEGKTDIINIKAPSLSEYQEKNKKLYRYGYPVNCRQGIIDLMQKHRHLDMQPLPVLRHCLYSELNKSTFELLTLIKRRFPNPLNHETPESVLMKILRLKQGQAAAKEYIIAHQTDPNVYSQYIMLKALHHCCFLDTDWTDLAFANAIKLLKNSNSRIAEEACGLWAILAESTSPTIFQTVQKFIDEHLQSNNVRNQFVILKALQQYYSLDEQWAQLACSKAAELIKSADMSIVQEASKLWILLAESKSAEAYQAVLSSYSNNSKPTEALSLACMEIIGTLLRLNKVSQNNIKQLKDAALSCGETDIIKYLNIKQSQRRNAIVVA